MSEMASEQVNELAKAMAGAQAEMRNAPLNRVNPHFKAKYADLAAIRDATVPVLSKHGLAVVQFTEVVEAGMLLHTRLLHSSGQWIDSTYLLLHDKPQAVGSALTYARRYSLASICGIAAEEDDDANAAQDRTTNGNGASTTIDAAQYRHLQAMMDEVQADEGKLLAYLKVDDLHTLTQAQYRTATAAMEKKRAQKVTGDASTLNGGK